MKNVTEEQKARVVNSAGIWTRRPSTGDIPSPSSVPSMCAIDAKIYVFGGVYDNFEAEKYLPSNDLHSYDTVSDCWSEIRPEGQAPSPRGFIIPIVDEENQRFLFHGGNVFESDLQVESYSDMWVYSIPDNRWHMLEPHGPIPPSRSFPCIWRSNRKMYLFGGISSTFQCLNDLWSYDLDANMWEELIQHGDPNSPPGRVAGSSSKVPLDNGLLMYGGEYVNAKKEFDFLSDVWSFDLSAEKWREVFTGASPDSFPQRQVYGASEVIGDFFYLYGGDYSRPETLPGMTEGAPHPQDPTNKLWRFDLGSRSWALLYPDGDPLPAMKRLSSATVNGTMYIWGGFGWNYPGQIWNTNIYSYQP